MIARIFSTNRVFIFAFIPIFLLVFRSVSVVNVPPVLMSGQLPWISRIFSFLNDLPVANLLLTVGLITIQAYHLARICDRQRLFDRSSNLAGFILAINYSLFTAHHFLSPALVANLFLILSFQRILSVYNQASVIPELFRAGLYIGIATIFYKPSLFFFLILTYQLLVSRTYNWREHLVPFLAMLLPSIYLLSYYYLLDDISIFSNWIYYGQDYFSIEGTGLLIWIAPSISILITLLALGHLLSSSLTRTIRINNLYKVLFVAFMLGILQVFLFSGDVYSSFLLCLPALSILQAHYLLELNKNWIREFIVYLLIGVIVIRELVLL